MRNFGRRILDRLPLPPSVLELYERFEEGVFGAVGLKHLPILAFLTGLIWLTEGLRLYIVVLAFGLPGRRARAVGGDLRRAHRLAADGHPAQPGRPRLRPGRRHRRPDRGVRRAAARSDRDHDPRLGHQRAVDHRVRGDPVRRLADAARAWAGSRSRRAAQAAADRLRPARPNLRSLRYHPGDLRSVQCPRTYKGHGVVRRRAQTGPRRTAPDSHAPCACPRRRPVPTGDTGVTRPHR